MLYKSKMSNKILNPKTGKYVLKSGKVGKELVINQNKLN